VGKKGGEVTLPARNPRQEDLAPWCQSRMAEGGIVPPHSVLAPGTALRSVPTVALSSAQVKVIVGAPKWLSNWTNQRGEKRSAGSARLFDRSCPMATRDPSRLGQLDADRGCGGLSQ
jgi:hypothetical protein